MCQCSLPGIRKPQTLGIREDWTLKGGVLSEVKEQESSVLKTHMVKIIAISEGQFVMTYSTYLCLYCMYEGLPARTSSRGLFPTGREGRI